MPLTRNKKSLRFSGAGLVVAAAVLLGGELGFAPVVASQTCAGSVSASVSAASLPGGSWEVVDGCLTSDAFFEYSNTEGRAQVAVALVTYADGHAGRVAVGMLVTAGGAALSIVGVEDSATGLVKWSAVLGTAQQIGDQTSVSGTGFMVFPAETAQLTAMIKGTGTNIATLSDSATPTTTSPTTTIDSPTATALAPVIDANRALPAPEVGGTGPIDTGPIDTGPIDTGPIDTGPIDTSATR